MGADPVFFAFLRCCALLLLTSFRCHVYACALCYICLPLTHRALCTAFIADASSKREINQFHFTSWPDHGVPTEPSAVLSFLMRIKQVGNDVSPVQ